MLKFEDFQPLDKAYAQFKFQQLSLANPLATDTPIYSDNEGHRYSYMQFDSLQQLKIMDSIAKSGILLNYRGALIKEGKLLGFYSIQEFKNMQDYADKLVTNNEAADQRFCIQYFQSFILILLQLQKYGHYLKIINPFMIGLRNPESPTNVGFGLLLPFPCRFFNCILRQQYELNIKFVAPEIIRHFVSNPTEEVCQKQFRKSGLYSLGLVLFVCFGYTFTSKQRIEASKNDKEFRNTFKKIRKQIKLLHTGKYVPKALKLLLEDCQKSREIIETFSLKIKSPQFDVLKICKNINTNDYRFYSTLSDSNKSQIPKSSKTINIQINENSSPMTITPISNKMQMLKVEEQNQNSPINIQISYGDEAPQSIWLSKVKKQRIISEEFIEDQQEKQQQKYMVDVEEIQGKKKFIEQIHEQESMRKMEQTEDVEVYQYSGVNERKIGRSRQNSMDNPQETVLDIPQFGDQQHFDQKSILRRKFENESKLIMAIILLSFFLYGVAGYIRQNS